MVVRVFEGAFVEDPRTNAGFRGLGLAGLRELATASESFERIGKVFYFHTPDGIARSKLAARANKLLGVEMTARNLSTVRKLGEMLGS